MDLKNVCSVCEKTFIHKRNVNRHSAKAHGVKEKIKSSKHQNIQCHECEKTFFDKQTLNKHYKTHFNVVKRPTINNLLKCLDCNLHYASREILLVHLKTTHNFKEEFVERDFETMEDFYLWLKDIEYKDNVQYVRNVGKQIGQQYTRYYYECNRSGMLLSKDIRKRQLKSQGSAKCGIICTSHLVVRKNNNTNGVTMKFWKSHYGHAIQLQHIRISESDRKNIAGKLLLSVPVPKILDSIRDSIGDELVRIDLTTKKDIYNIKKSFKIDIVDGIRHPDDATSVSLWMKECKASEDNPVLFYKPQGSEDINYKLQVSDFCLILMTKLQISMIKKFAIKFVCLDGTHGTNPYDFELTTLLVSDEFGEGFPVAYMISNRKDTQIYEVFFKVLKKTVGIVTPETFMTDITETYYNAWKIVMGTVSNRLYCSWHVDRAWSINLTKIVSNVYEFSIKKRKDVYNALKTIQKTLDIESFSNYYHEFLVQLENDSDTKKFHEYFVKHYGNNIKSWAYCYRKELLINTNMYIESMHRIIKYEYLEGRKVKRLDKSIHNLMRFTRDKQVERIIKLTKGKISNRIHTINASHKTALNSNFELLVMEDDNGCRKWSVTNTEKKSSHVVIERSNESCCALICQKCNICYHSYKCTCIMYSIKSEICKHIHFVRLQENDNLQNSIANNYSCEENIDSCLVGLDKVPKEKEQMQNKLVNVALELVTLANKPQSYKILSTAVKQVSATNALLKMDLSNSKPFQQTVEAKLEPSNKKIAKQISFYSTKKNKTKRIKNPTDNEQLIFSKDVLNISDSCMHDHTYYKFV